MTTSPENKISGNTLARRFLSVFLLLGLLMSGIAIWVYQDTRAFLDSAITVQGEVIELIPVSSSDHGTMYRPLVRFQSLEGEWIEVSPGSASSPPAYDVGETVEVFYQAGKPHSAKISGFFSLWGGVLILGILGGVFTLLGGGLLWTTFPRDLLDLKTKGREIQAQITAITPDTTRELNGQHPWRIYAQWLDPETQEQHQFQSRPLWLDPQPFITGDTITVYLDPVKTKRYRMDLSFLPKVKKVKPAATKQGE